MKKYTIPTSQIESWIKAADRPTQQAVRWLHHHALAGDIPTNALAAKLKKPNGTAYSPDSVYQYLTGRRDLAATKNMTKAVLALEKIEHERQSITRAGFVETNLTKQIFKIADTARNFCKIMFIIGPSHIGKTTALREYARRNNSGATLYLRAPAGGSKGRTLLNLLELLNLPRYGASIRQEQAILNAIDNTQVLIIDEAHQYLAGTLGLKTLEFIREIHDTTGCGLIFSATHVFTDALTRGDETAKWLNQTRQRHLIHAKLPDKPTKANLNAFARHFGLDPATDQALDLQTEIIRHDSLGRWLSILEGASRIASKSGEDLTWSHVLKSHAALSSLEGNS